MAAVRHRSSEGSSSSSSTTAEHQDPTPGQSYDDTDVVEDVYEQRRVRHITAILLRNVFTPHAASHRRIGPLQRPAPRRSLSTASTTSVNTLRRSPSNRTIRPTTRRRASSIVSTHMPEDLETHMHVYQPRSVLASWDAASLRATLLARFSLSFVSLARCSDGHVFYRTPISRRTGLHHDWGRVPGSDIEPGGIDLSAVAEGDDIGGDDAVRLAVWASSTSNVTEEGDQQHQIEPGAEAMNGFQLVWERDVELQKLSKVQGDIAAVSLSLPVNSVLLGLSNSLSQVRLADEEESEQSGQIKRMNDSRRGAVKSNNEVQYYIVTPTPSEAEAASITEKDANGMSVVRARGNQRGLSKGGKMVRAYDVADILRLLQLQRQRYELQCDMEEARQRCDSKLVDQKGLLVRALKLGEAGERLKVLHAERDAMRENVKAKRNEVQERDHALHRRRARLEIARRMMTNRQRAYDDLRRRLTQLAKLRSIAEARIYARRVVLLRQLEYIYPIEVVDGAQLLFAIVGIPLANRDGKEDMSRNKDPSVDKLEQDDDTVSSALGMIAQMVALTSAYTDTPLHYPIATAGSRSVIQDGISVMSGPRAFPLFAKGVERYRFEYGHFLLNKDIEQLMNHAGITILDIRNTLPNLKNLIVTLCASSQPSSKLSRRNHVGAEMISLPASSRDTALSLGIGLPSTTASDGQIGYGTVIATGTNDHQSKRTSRWGMSLLGWGSTTESKLHDKQSSSADHGTGSSASDMPTVRTLGKTT